MSDPHERTELDDMDGPDHEDITCPDCGVTLAWDDESRLYVCVCGYSDDGLEGCDGSEGDWP